MDVEFYITYPIEKNKEVMRLIRSMGCKPADMFLCQYEAYLATLPFISMTARKSSETINPIAASAVAGMFPFVIKELFDKDGIYLGGSNGLPVFKNIFHRDEDRKNSNCVVFGTSGGGKSYFLKKELLNFYIEGKKIFVLDPDNEYKRFYKVFGIGYVDLAGLQDQRINPLQVFPAFKDDEDGGVANEVSAHLVFLEQFFSTVLPSLDGTQRDAILGYIGELYRQYNITDEVNVSELSPEQFPTFDDLYKYISERQQQLISNRRVEEEYELRQLSPIIMAIQKFTDGGMYASLWNGYTTLKINNDFTVFNFQSLFATGNTNVTNAQMLLVIKYLNQEVIKNRETQGGNIIIAIDEAHRFIDGKFTVGLDFMQQEAKQIRKYFGSLIVATQNINDFCGASPEMRQKAAAVINCCQYSYVFNLAPDDINSILELYKNYNGGLQQEEINYISTARRGDCLFMASKDIRLPVHITCFPDEDEYFLEPKTNTTLIA
jgi:type IV secretory pathway VirB4 component